MKKLVLIFAGGLLMIQAKSQTLKQAVSYTDNELFETSSQMFYKLIAAKPGDAELLYYMGENFFASERPDSATAYYDKGIITNPSYALNYVGKGKIALANKDEAQAKTLFTRARELSANKNAEVFIKIGEAYVITETKNTHPAFEVLTLAEKLDPKNIKIYLLEGDAQLLLDNDGSKAIGFYDKAAALDPKSPMPNVHTGALYEKARAYDLAFAEYDNAMKKDSTYAPAYRQLGYLYYQFGNYEKAVTYYKKFVNMTGNILSSKVVYAKFLYLAGKYPEAIEVLNEIIAVDKSINVLNRLLAYSYYQTKQYDDALFFLELFLKNAETGKNPILVSDYSYYGKILAAKGEDSLATFQFKKAIDMDTTVLETYTDLANSYKKKSKFDDAVNTQLLKLRRTAAPTANDYYVLGQFYYSKGGAAVDTVEKFNAFQDADSVFAIVAEKMPTQIGVFVFRARANAGMDPRTTVGLAKPFYEKVIELGDADPVKNKVALVEANYYLAYYYFNQKDKANALLYTNKVLAIDPAHAQSKNLLVLINKYLKDTPASTGK